MAGTYEFSSARRSLGMLEVLRDFDRVSEEPVEQLVEWVRLWTPSESASIGSGSQLSRSGSRHSSTMAPAARAPRVADGGVSIRLCDAPDTLAEPLER